LIRQRKLPCGAPKHLAITVSASSQAPSRVFNSVSLRPILSSVWWG